MFLPSEIEQVITDEEIKFNPACTVSMGIDPGFGSSKFGVTILQLENDIFKVVYAKEWDRPSYEDMIYSIGKLRHEYRPVKIYVDGAKPDFIKSLKIQFNETVDYERVIKQANHDKIDYEYRMNVVPVSFNEGVKSY